MAETERDELKEKLLKELNLTEEDLQDGVSNMKDWLLNQSHLPHNLDDNMLKAFIVGSKSVERAKEKLDKYYSARTKLPDVFNNRDPLLIEWHRVQKMYLLPGLTPDGYNVVLVVPPYTKEDLKFFSLSESGKMAFMLYDRIVRHQPFSAGQYIVFDSRHFTFELGLKFTSTLLARLLSYYQNAMPIRIKAIIGINCSSITVAVTKIVKPFFTDKLRERIFNYSEDHTALSNFFPLEMLPEEYGGKSPPLDQLLGNLKTDLEGDRDWFIAADIQDSQECKADTDQQTDALQVELKKLEID